MISRGTAGFEGARVDRIFNRRLPERQPAAVVRPETEADVVTAVRLARDRGWQVAVRSGGHSWAQWSLRDDALVIDLGGLREMEYDAATGIVTASPSTQGGAELAPYLAERGRFFVGGHCPTVGIGGFLLQGGQGWNARGWGWAAEYVVAVDVVTADGELVRADATQNTDLYWAARGAGPGFPGVVTRFHLQTRPLPGHVAHTVQAFDLADFDEVMTWLHETHGTVADTVEIVALTRTDPHLAPGPVLLVTALAMVDDQHEADQALAPFRTNPAIDRAILVIDNEPTTPEAERARQLEDNPEGHRWAVDNAWLSGPASEVVPAMRRAYTTLPNEKAFTIWFSMAPLRALPDMAFSVQSEIYLAAYVPWEDPVDDERHQAWLASVMADLAPVTVGQYLGDSDLRRRPHRCLSEEASARLEQVYAERDPERLFVGYLAQASVRRPLVG
ncbi:FAD-binding protein [Nocardioides sp. MAH-18]|uniref:FAD-binding protein n=1 Tax=Nocardioides agri TaxID=2682843 RepID=A0A6L6XSG1_9ACTN|nr:MULTISPECIES: FAD-binding protein [unclassified Nocardioides]MBA2955299.1 FAD-binding oxidoreductase [Nocardioides sp. CGMCC 1.13656]MVQ50150.1 FAD-binding protein [Nocardioides sp. MAH-18]